MLCACGLCAHRHQFLRFKSCTWIPVGGCGNDQQKIAVGSRTEMVAVIGHDLVAQRVETGWDSVGAKICRGLCEMNDGDQRGLCKLRIGDAFYVFLRLRWNTLAYPEVTNWSGGIKRQAISFCVECLPHGLRNGVVSQRTNTLHFAGLRGAEQ